MNHEVIKNKLFAFHEIYDSFVIAFILIYAILDIAKWYMNQTSQAIKM